ncbi:hypothetical protein Pmani_034882 [Petrolisthes manimaculis]|uniref:Uncharacterized protein n=1 Tax=Petrolisthes manimaculis TaxID=1843537 RepID=A0AAE1TNQ2_9EUCA|nr:hypothetical protein Pmani_034882 [Petrolisthes manimaculis]
MQRGSTTRPEKWPPVLGSGPVAAAVREEAFNPSKLNTLRLSLTPGRFSDCLNPVSPLRILASRLHQ